MERELDLKNIQITDEFWSARQRLITEVVIPYQEDIMNDRIPDIEKSHALANFRIAAGLEEGTFYGMVFQDSDVAKWLEGVAYSLAIHPDAALEARADEIIDVMEKAQEEDGYLDTYFILKAPDEKFTDLMECHEMYCAGHLMEAAVAYYESTGKDKLVRICQRMADCIDSHIGPEEGKIHGYPGHEEIELGLLRMYEVTGNEKDLALAAYFIRERGKMPASSRKSSRQGAARPFWGGAHIDLPYYQAHDVVTKQDTAKGHAVRCMYLYSGVAEYALLTGDEELKKACDVLFDDVVRKQMYITGGIGQVADWEGFSHDYDLPNDTAYAETCASIGLVFLAHRLLKMRADRKYADILERALYNGVLSGMQLDGKRFFYVNPLEVNPDLSGKLPGYRHVLPQRPQWYACACCPPNVTRLVTSLGKYAWDEIPAGTAHGANESALDTVYSHLFVGGEAKLSHAVIRTETCYPWNGRVSYTIDNADGSEWRLAIRIPGYASEVTVTVNGTAVALADITENATAFGESDRITAALASGYLYLTAAFTTGDTIEVSFPMEPRVSYSNPKVRANAGCIALERGPLVYCFEGVDNGADKGQLLQELRVPADAAITPQPITEGALDGLYALDLAGERCYFENENTEDELLYSQARPLHEEVNLRAIPYFAWGNRGINQMRVWMPEK